MVEHKNEQYTMLIKNRTNDSLIFDKRRPCAQPAAPADLSKYRIGSKSVPNHASCTKYDSNKHRRKLKLFDCCI